jgi:hypothetical protein
MENKHIKAYLCEHKSLIDSFAKKKNDYNKSFLDLETHQQKQDARNDFMFILCYLSDAVKHYQLKLQYQKKERTKKYAKKQVHDAKKDLIVRLGRDYMTGDKTVSQNLRQLESRHQTMQGAFDHVQAVQKQLHHTLRTIEIALAETDNATNSEVIEMGFDNVLTDAQSLSAREDASASIGKVNRELMKLQKNLGEEYKHFQHIHFDCKMEWLDMALTWSAPDIIDQAISLHNLNTLSIATNKLESIKYKLKDIAEKWIRIYSDAAKDSLSIKNEMLAFKNEHRKSALPLIHKHGIEFTANDVEKITALYPTE